MGTQVSGLCRVCLAEDAVEEEHVWPAGYLSRLDKVAKPPLAWTSNGDPLVKSNGSAFVAQGGRQRVFLPVCRSCNCKMEKFIEHPAQQLVVDCVLGNWSALLSQDQWASVGRWWAKVLFMLGHPDLRFGDQGLQSAKPLASLGFTGTPPDLSWLSENLPPPPEASLFVYRIDPSLQPSTKHHLVFPSSVRFTDGSTAECHHMSMATSTIGFLAVWHPGLVIEHPVLVDGQGWELLHSPPAELVALDSLPPLNQHHVAVVQGAAQVEAGHHVNPSEYSRLLATFDDAHGISVSDEDPPAE